MKEEFVRLKKQFWYKPIARQVETSGNWTAIYLLPLVENQCRHTIIYALRTSI